MQTGTSCILMFHSDSELAGTVGSAHTTSGTCSFPARTTVLLLYPPHRGFTMNVLRKSVIKEQLLWALFKACFDEDDTSTAPGLEDGGTTPFSSPGKNKSDEEEYELVSIFAACSVLTPDSSDDSLMIVGDVAGGVSGIKSSTKSLNPKRSHILYVTCVLAPHCGTVGVKVFKEYLLNTPSTSFQTDFVKSMVGMVESLCNENLLSVFKQLPPHLQKLVVKEAKKSCIAARKELSRGAVGVQVGGCRCMQVGRLSVYAGRGLSVYAGGIRGAVGVCR